MSETIKNQFDTLIGRLTNRDLSDYLQFAFRGKGNALDTGIGKDKEVMPGYSDSEKQILLNIAKEALASIDVIVAGTHDLQSSHNPFIAIAGPPGAGKSTVALQALAEAACLLLPEPLWEEVPLQGVITAVHQGINLRYLNTDRVSLGAIYNVLVASNPKLAHDLDFYKKWTWGARFLNTVVTEYAMQKNIPLVQDATYGSPGPLRVARSMRERGRPTIITLVGAPDDVRKEAMDNRARAGYVQSDATVTEKQKQEFSNNIPGIVSAFDTVFITHRNAPNVEPTLAAVINKGRIRIIDQEKFESFCETFPAMREVVPTLTVDPALTITSIVEWLKPFLLPLKKGGANLAVPAPEP